MDIIDRRYQVEEKLASGGFGSIYRVTDLAIGRQVALKILHRELAGDHHVVARFRREAAALATLKSPHTVTLYDVGTTNDTLYLVMELLRGESLQHVFEQTGPLPWRRMARIARGVCASLREAHARGIVHRDLKPANIVLERHALDLDVVKVLDFGIAKILETSELASQDLTRHGQMIGTWEYMSPEQMVGGLCTAKTDVFALGVVLYEMITGRRPYGDHPSPAATMMALLTRPPALLTGMPPELAATIMACVAREPEHRPAIDTLDAVLERALAAPEDEDDEPTQFDARHLRPRAATQPAAAHLTTTPLHGGALAPTIPVNVGAPSMAPSVIVEPTVNIRGSSAGIPLARGSDSALAARDSQRVLARRSSHEALAATVELAVASVAADSPGATPLVVTASGAIAVDRPSDPAGRASITPVARPASSVNVRFTPVEPVSAPRTRLAAGTAPIANEVVAPPSTVQASPELPSAAASPGIGALRLLTVAACLFGFGFVVALAFGSV